MDLSTNPLAVLTFLSTPAVLTNASCVLLFGTGNRYGRAIDRMHELTATLRERANTSKDETELRRNQLRAGERRVALIVRALTCFYAAVAGFAASTLLSLTGTIIHSSGETSLAALLLTGGLALGAAGILAIIAGAAMLVRESWFSFRILQEERAFLSQLLL